MKISTAIRQAMISVDAVLAGLPDELADIIHSISVEEYPPEEKIVIWATAYGVTENRLLSDNLQRIGFTVETVDPVEFGFSDDPWWRKLHRAAKGAVSMFWFSWILEDGNA